MTIVVLDEAENDIAKGMLFYEKQKNGLGNYFLNSILSDIESLHIYSGIHVKVKDYFRLLSKRFPFAIYYKVKDKTISIYAVLDCRQNPLRSDKRLK